MNRFRHARKVLAASMFVMGACGIAYEYTLGALGNNLMGSSHEQIFVVIGLMMFAMGLGATLQKHISGNLVDKFLLVEILLGLTGGISALVIYLAYVYSSIYMLLLWGFALGIGVLIGLEIPLLIRINREYSASLKTNLSEILSMDYVGALVGALLFTFVLFANLSVNQIAVVLGCANLLLALLGLAYFRPLLRHFRKLLLLSCAGAALLGCLLALSEDWRVSLEQRTYSDPIIYSHTSRYQHIVLTRRNDRLSLFINGHLQFNSRDERIYHEMLVHVPFAVASSRARVLILGGGDGLALREVLKYEAVRRVDLVDIDPSMTDLAATHPDLVRLNRGALLDGRVTLRPALGVSEGEIRTVSRPSKLARSLLSDTVYPQARVRVYNLDADLFVRGLQGPYDLVIVDFPDPKSVGTAKLYSLDFYRRLARQLGPSGLVAVQSTSPYHSREMFLCIGKTLRAAGYRALPYRQNVPSFGEWGWHLAWLHETSESDMKEKLEGLTSIGVPTGYLTAALVSNATAFGKRWLDDAHIEINTKFRPTILQYHRQSWRN